MSITVLSNVIAPDRIWAAGVSGRQVRLNARAQNQGGQMAINIVRSRTVRKFDIGTTPIREDTSDEHFRNRVLIWQALEGLHEVTEGGAYGFLIRDPKDSTANHASGRATLIDAGTHTYQLVKRYTSVGSTLTKDRKITRPIAAGFGLKLAGVTSGSFTLGESTGVITIPSDPVASTITWSGSFYTPVHFEQDAIDWDILIAGQIGTRHVAIPAVTLSEILE